MLVDPLPIFVNVAGIDHKQVLCGRVHIDDEVVNNTAFPIWEASVLRLTCFKAADVVGGQVLQELERTLTFHPELAHVAHVEHAYAFAHADVLVVDARRVLNGHVETCELGHFCAQRNVYVGKWCGFKHDILFLRFYKLNSFI